MTNLKQSQGQGANQKAPAPESTLAPPALAATTSEEGLEAGTSMPEIQEGTTKEGLKSFTLGPLKCLIERDDEPPNPRINFDNVGVMACFHKKYRLGDENHGIRSEDHSGWDAMEASILAEHPDALILPVYLYDHSGLTISTAPFSGFDPGGWDSGRVGLVYATTEKIKEEWGEGPEARDQAEKVLEGEVKDYDAFLRGDVLGWRLLDKDGDTADSCYGFFGQEDVEAEAKSALKSAYQALVPKWDDLKKQIRPWKFFESNAESMSARDFVKGLKSGFDDLEEMNSEVIYSQANDGARELLREAGHDVDWVREEFPTEFDELATAVQEAMNFNVEALAPTRLLILADEEIEIPHMFDRSDEEEPDSPLQCLRKAGLAAGFTEAQVMDVYRNASGGGVAAVGVIADGDDVVTASRTEPSTEGTTTISGQPILYCRNSMEGSGYYATLKGSRGLAVKSLADCVDYGSYSLGAVFGTGDWNY